MQPSDSRPEGSANTKTVAAIDLGSNSLRMVIAEVLPDGRIEVLEQYQRAVRMGQDTFRRSRLGAQRMRAVVAVLRDYRRALELYGVERIRAVATTAVREATNAETFLDRVFMATGLNLEVIGTSEESRLTVSAVRHAVGGALGIDRDETLIADVGGGSTLLTLLEDGEIVNSQSLRLGSIRLQEMLSTSEDPPERSAELLRHHIGNVISSTQVLLPLKRIRSFVAMGGDARFAAREIGKPTASADLYSVSEAEFDKLVRRCQRKTAEELGKLHGLPFEEAETLNPALLVYQILLHHTRAKQMLVSNVSMRDGLLLELARNVTGEEDEALLEDYKRPFLMLRRTPGNTGSGFLAVLQPYAGNEPPREITSLHADSSGFAIAVRESDHVDVVFRNRTDWSPVRVDGVILRMQGAVGCARLRDGALQHAWVQSGTSAVGRIQCGASRLESPAMVHGAIVAVHNTYVDTPWVDVEDPCGMMRPQAGRVLELQRGETTCPAVATGTSGHGAFTRVFLRTVPGFEFCADGASTRDTGFPGGLVDGGATLTWHPCATLTEQP